MSKLDKIRNTRVDAKFSRSHVQSVHRVKRKLDRLHGHYGKPKKPSSLLDGLTDHPAGQFTQCNTNGDYSMQITQDGEAESTKGSLIQGLISINNGGFTRPVTNQ